MRRLKPWMMPESTTMSDAEYRRAWWNRVQRRRGKFRALMLGLSNRVHWAKPLFSRFAIQHAYGRTLVSVSLIKENMKAKGRSRG